VQDAALLRACRFLSGSQRLELLHADSAVVGCVLPVAALQDELERLKAENARLFRDNERFVRLVSMGTSSNVSYLCPPQFTKQLRS
jgi:hypothetical protein